MGFIGHVCFTSLKNLSCLRVFQERFYTWNTHLGLCMIELINLSCQKNKHLEAGLHLNNRLNVLLNLKENFTFSTHFHERYSHLSS